MTNYEVADKIGIFLDKIFKTFNSFEYTVTHDSACYFLANILYKGTVKTSVIFYTAYDSNKIYFSEKFDNNNAIYNYINLSDDADNSKAIIDFWSILSMDYAYRLRNN